MTTALAVSVAVSRLRGAAFAVRREREIRRQCFPPKPQLTASQWADAFGMLPRSTSAEPGRWRTDRAPYQRGILDAISDPRAERVCWVAPSQSGKTACVLKGIGYFIDQDPAPMLVVQPSLDFARDFSRDRLKPEIQATPVLKAKVRESGGRRESSETLLRKEYPGGYLTLVGANSATGLSSRPIRVVLFDEIDKYPPSAGDKGDPIALGVNRTKNFWNRKIVFVSTPGVRGRSRIEKEWNESDQRRFFVPCPDCGEFQHLQWKQIQFESAAYKCEHCGSLIPETSKPAMLARGEWRATRPEGTFPGFHLNALYSPWTTWKELVAKFLVAKKAPDTLQVFVNEDLAEWWDPQEGEAVDTNTLGARRERYAAEVPRSFGVLTAFVDPMPDWIELEVKAWGAGQESAIIAHHRLMGSTALPDVWNRLDPLLTKTYKHESGAELHIALCGVDSGDGSNVHPVYTFVAPRQKRTVCPVFATKGSSVRGRPIIAARPSKRNKYNVRIFSIGTDTAKDVLFARLKLKRADDGSYPPGFVHIPLEQKDGGCDDEFLDQFAREKAFTRYERGVAYRVYEVVPKGARNEAIDLEVGNLHMLHLLGAGVFDQLGTWVAKANAAGARAAAAAAASSTTATPATEVTAVAAAAAPEQVTEPAPPPPAPPRAAPPGRRPPRRPGGGYVNSWKR